MVKMPYRLWKKFYDQFPAEDYDPKTKTILVDLPATRRRPFPKSWYRYGNRYITPGGCEVVFWNTGLAENFVVRKFHPHFPKSRTIPPGIDARERVMACVAEFESEESACKYN